MQEKDIRCLQAPLEGRVGSCTRTYGCRLMGQTAATLVAPSCADPARDVALGVVESLLDLGDDVAAPVLNPHMGLLLEALRAVVVASNEQPGQGVQKGDRKAGKVVLQAGRRLLIF